ncbi:MAG: tRNA-modifying protein YgfZ, partial [Rickettsiales bacterium]|nr:tRNA-modifying protein YgfZ [Rickettsiales bacterium]
IKIFHNFSQSGFVDPRHQNLGFRFYTKENLLNSTSDLSLYNFKRISLKIAQGEEDLTYEKSVILEFDFDNLNAIDYQKGCYVGQELTARTHYLGEVRKKIFHVEISNLKEIEKNTEITCQGNSAGIILSSVFFQSKLHALALIRLTQDQNFSDFKENLQTLGQKIFIVA